MVSLTGAVRIVSYVTSLSTSLAVALLTAIFPKVRTPHVAVITLIYLGRAIAGTVQYCFRWYAQIPLHIFPWRVPPPPVVGSTGDGVWVSVSFQIFWGVIFVGGIAPGVYVMDLF